ncbi:hypothetical protein [Rhodovastum atsumiense]|uniref:Uncharacterized protein n=1 Tax=Rhodovastum atsumiense TaxID=504468 RepID=A0A5M6IJY8_9PROT|nr:hypothetical protein [Rhodovastum atsumiense]KAA5608159.1 hypothetical protein F1189_30395 [Rhodovastum atsumiense]
MPEFLRAGPRRVVSSGPLGERIASSAPALLIAAFLAIVTWEGTNGRLDRRIARMAARGDIAHSARLRTLLPLLRSSPPPGAPAAQRRCAGTGTVFAGLVSCL